jgi:glycerol-3-phosphate dehydrogenase
MERTIDFDLIIIGAGINGSGIARDAAGRGLRVCLIERDDLAQYTSSASTKLVHGGLRYLEHYEFMLVRKALIEREVIMRIAPHITWPLRFVVPHDPSMRPVWMMRAGLFLYDHLAKRELLEGSTHIRFDKHVSGGPLREGYQHGFIYSDGWVDDSRLVLLNALDAHERGAQVQVRTACVAARRHTDFWEVDTLASHGERSTVTARAVVNAAGPWVAQLLSGALGQNSHHRLRLVKGSHIVIKRLYDHPFVYLLQNDDKRVIFAIPYEQDFTLVGTTDIEIQGNAADATIDPQEIEYLCAAVNRFFKRNLGPADVIHTYCGVRPLLDDASGNASEVTRDYSLELDLTAAPILSVFGGKITTYRKLAEEALEKLAPSLQFANQSWTGSAALPGGEFAVVAIGRVTDEFSRAHDWLTETAARRLIRAYGLRVYEFFPQSLQEAGAAISIEQGLYEAELKYSRDVEFSRTADDFLWRRSKLGLHLNAEQVKRVHDFEWGRSN